ncbi:RNA 2',3'-cyclic phosphodiesterase [Candidatus Wolfebacteria bacterium]|nr:RNA 2',3'-cyclic phosphodiesterase [Candidatus Wolfebacteria bacterium]
MRLFIAINLPKETKQKITKLIKKINFEKISDKSDFRWVSDNNWHLTVSFLGYQSEETIPVILQAIKKTIENFSAPFIEFEKIILGPQSKTPRMIWLIGSNQTSKKLNEIKNCLENELIKNKIKFQRENRLFTAHLTLARFPINKYLKIGFPNIEKMSFSTQSLDLMESRLKETGAEYEILKRVDFI